MTDPNELFDVCDVDDRVIGQATRQRVHAEGLLHRAVHIFLFNSRGELLVQKRSAAKDEYPLCETSSASGHVDAGEDYDTAAARELGEELGLSAPLQRIQKFPAGPDTANEHTVLYVARTDEAPRPDAAEIHSLHWEALPELSADMEARPHRYSPPFRTLVRWYMESSHRPHPPEP